MKPPFASQNVSPAASGRAPMGLRALFLSVAIIIVMAANAPLAALAARVILH